jgi:MFS family permease
MRAADWRTPERILLICGVIITVAMGTRNTLGLFMQPMIVSHGWTRETFAFALALQNLVLGATSPFTGALADRFGSVRVMCTGGILYTLGLIAMGFTQTGWQLDLAAGVLIGVGQSCTTYTVVFGLLGKLFPPERRTMVFGTASAAGSIGQFVMVPYAGSLIAHLDWFGALTVMACTTFLITPLAALLIEGGARARAAAVAARQRPTQSGREALAEAFGHRGYVLLVTGYFVCGFQLAFITVHLPSYVTDLGFAPSVGVTALALVGLVNIFGSLAAGFLGQRYSKKRLLAGIYFSRAIGVALFITLPPSPWTIWGFAILMGSGWLATVPLTSGLIGQIFGTTWMATLSGIAFFSHQAGSFLGVWLGGWLYDHTGSYQVTWLVSIGLGLFAAVVNLPIDERPLKRLQAQPA